MFCGMFSVCFRYVLRFVSRGVLAAFLMGPPPQCISIKLSETELRVRHDASGGRGENTAKDQPHSATVGDILRSFGKLQQRRFGFGTRPNSLRLAGRVCSANGLRLRRRRRLCLRLWRLGLLLSWGLSHRYLASRNTQLVAIGSSARFRAELHKHKFLLKQLTNKYKDTAAVSSSRLWSLCKIYESR